MIGLLLFNFNVIISWWVDYYFIFNVVIQWTRISTKSCKIFVYQWKVEIITKIYRHDSIVAKLFNYQWYKSSVCFIFFDHHLFSVLSFLINILWVFVFLIFFGFGSLLIYNEFTKIMQLRIKILSVNMH